MCTNGWREERNMHPYRWTLMIQTVKTMTSNNMHPSINIRFSIRSLAPYAFVAILSACGSSPTQDAKTASADKPVADTVPVFLLKAETLKKKVELPRELIPHEKTNLYPKESVSGPTITLDIGSPIPHTPH